MNETGIRQQLLEVFKQFRAGSDESDSNYSNRDETEAKLQDGSELNELDCHMLKVAIYNVVQDDDTAHRLAKEVDAL